jgi:hypothetical protein
LIRYLKLFTLQIADRLVVIVNRCDMQSDPICGLRCPQTEDPTNDSQGTRNYNRNDPTHTHRHSSCDVLGKMPQSAVEDQTYCSFVDFCRRR